MTNIPALIFLALIMFLFGSMLLSQGRCERRVRKKNEELQKKFKEDQEFAKAHGLKPPPPPLRWVCG